MTKKSCRNGSFSDIFLISTINHEAIEKQTCLFGISLYVLQISVVYGPSEVDIFGAPDSWQQHLLAGSSCPLSVLIVCPMNIFFYDLQWSPIKGKNQEHYSRIITDWANA